MRMRVRFGSPAIIDHRLVITTLTTPDAMACAKNAKVGAMKSSENDTISSAAAGGSASAMGTPADFKVLTRFRVPAVYIASSPSADGPLGRTSTSTFSGHGSGIPLTQQGYCRPRVR